MIKIIDDFYKDTDLLDDLYRYFYYAGTWQFDYFPHKYVWKEKQNTDIEKKICTLIRRLCTTNNQFGSKGYEVWVNVLTDEDNHLSYHVDCEEDTPEGVVVPALKTATIYLGPHEEIKGGELVVNTQGLEHFRSFNDKSIFDVKKDLDSGEWITIPYKYNRVVLFDSYMPHAVLPITHIPQNHARITLTIAAWDKKVKIVR
jgi:hypothetical protein